ncbi:flagellar brake protein [Oceanobacillus sp. CAU 1775]
MKIGRNLSLELKEIGKKPEKFKCKIIDKTENEIIIDYPVNTMTLKQAFHPIGTTYKVEYRADDNAVYEFNSSIAKRVKLNIPALALTIPEKDKIKRIQRREFVRVDASIDVAVHSKHADFEPFTTITSDVSGGGISLIVPDSTKYSLGQGIDVWIVLKMNSDEIHYVYSDAEIVFIQVRDNIHTVAVKFLNIKSDQQQKIIRFCFEKQRESRKKELS